MLFGKRIYTLDMTSIVSVTKYRGQFEERLKALMKELETNPDIIVFIDAKVRRFFCVQFTVESLQEEIHEYL